MSLEELHRRIPEYDVDEAGRHVVLHLLERLLELAQRTSERVGMEYFNDAGQRAVRGRRRDVRAA